MSRYHLDSSALVKRYAAEIGSGWVLKLTDPGSQNALFMARVAWVEVLSALARRSREGWISAVDVSLAVRALGYDVDTQYTSLSSTHSLPRRQASS